MLTFGGHVSRGSRVYLDETCHGHVPLGDGTEVHGVLHIRCQWVAVEHVYIETAGIRLESCQSNVPDVSEACDGRVAVARVRRVREQIHYR
jgi:hypothetical protein